MQMSQMYSFFLDSLLPTRLDFLSTAEEVKEVRLKKVVSFHPCLLV